MERSRGSRRNITGSISRSGGRAVRIVVLLCAASCSLIACTQKVVDVPLPDRVDAFCNGAMFDEKAFVRVVDATPDQHLNTEGFSDATLRELAEQHRGALGYWNDEVVLDLPMAAHWVRPGDGRLHVRGVAVLEGPIEGIGGSNQGIVFHLEPMPKPSVWRWIHNVSSDSEPICK